MGVDVHGELGLRVVGELVIVLCTLHSVSCDVATGLRNSTGPQVRERNATREADLTAAHCTA